MIKLGGKYKLKKLNIPEIKDDETEYQVVAFLEKDLVICDRLDETSEQYIFKTDFLIDPDKPDDIYAPFELIDIQRS